MAPLPKGFSIQATPIEAAISEGRTDDARTLLCEILITGKADRVVQRLAAAMLKPPKKSKGRQKALPRHWYEIGEEFHKLRDGGSKYQNALELVSKKFGSSETHVRTCLTFFDQARETHDAIDRE